MCSDTSAPASAQDTSVVPKEGETRPLRHPKMIGRTLATQYNKDVRTLHDAFKLAVETYSTLISLISTILSMKFFRGQATAGNKKD